MTTSRETPERTAQRLGLPVALVRTHGGFHTCVDGKSYRISCLVTDPDCEDSARYYMQRHEGSETPAPIFEADGALTPRLGHTPNPLLSTRGSRRTDVETVPVGGLL